MSGGDQSVEGTMQFVKLVAVGILLLLGVLFIYEGMGFDFRILNFESLDPYMIPIGAAVVVLALLVSRFWRVAE
jgi:hypothetical protein